MGSLDIQVGHVRPLVLRSHAGLLRFAARYKHRTKQTNNNHITENFSNNMLSHVEHLKIGIYKYREMSPSVSLFIPQTEVGTQLLI